MVDQFPVPVSDEKNETSFRKSESSSSDEETENTDSTKRTLNSNQEDLPMDDLEQKQTAIPTEKIGNVLISRFFL